MRLWWCYRASVCAIGVTSLALSDSPLFSHIKSPKSPNHKSPTDYRNGLTFTVTQPEDDGPAHGCAGPYIQGQSGLPARRAASRGCLCWLSPASFRQGNARVADGRIQPAQSCTRGKDLARRFETKITTSFNGNAKCRAYMYSDVRTNFAFHSSTGHCLHRFKITVVWNFNVYFRFANEECHWNIG